MTRDERLPRSDPPAGELPRVEVGEIDILVNNVGGASAFPGGLSTIPEWELALAANHPAYVSLTNNTVFPVAPLAPGGRR